MDLDVPESASADDLRATMTRWAQQTRFASVLAIDGLRAGDARGVIVDASMNDIIAILRSVIT